MTPRQWSKEMDWHNGEINRGIEEIRNDIQRLIKQIIEEEEKG